jgi:hypothetical protein
MQHSNHRNVAADQTDLPIWLKVSSVTLTLLMFSVGPHLLFSQQDTNKQENTGNKQSTGKKVNPSSRGTINIQEIEKREKANKEAPKQKKIENENLKEPRDLPVPRGAKGKTYKVPPPEKKM